MEIGAARVTLYLDDTFSLKEKRGIVKSTVERARKRFNAAVAEVEDLDDLRVATIGVAVVSNSRRHAEEMLRTIIEFIERDARDAEIGEVESSIVPF